MKNYNANITTKALAIKKETSLDIIRNFQINVVRISSKAIFLTFVLTLLNMVV
ncbi:MAG: hypothetical protein ACI4UE_03165 [Candidatus Scatovivens sp.]